MRKSQHVTYTIHARPEWLAALDRLVAASGARDRAALIDWALVLYAEDVHPRVVLPPRCKPLGSNQYDREGETP